MEALLEGRGGGQGRVAEVEGAAQPVVGQDPTPPPHSLAGGTKVNFDALTESTPVPTVPFDAHNYISKIYNHICIRLTGCSNKHTNK